MADDEVPSLVELGVLHIGAERFFSVPADQIPKLPKPRRSGTRFHATRFGLLPANEFGYRVPSVICGILTSALVFLFAARCGACGLPSRSPSSRTAASLFVYLSQQNRFYSLPLLLLTLALALMGRRGAARSRLPGSRS